MSEKQKAKLFRIWSSDGNDRSEIAHVLAYDFEDVQNWALKNYIEPEFENEIELTDFGLEWSECDIKECLNENEDLEVNEDNICDCCDGNYRYIEIEEYEDFDEFDKDFKTIAGTNEYFNLTGDKPKKAEDFNKFLSSAWKISPEVGLAALVTDSTLTPQKGVNKEYLRECNDKLKKSGLKRE